MTPPPLTLQLFGPLRVTVRGEPLPRVRTRSVEWLLALLVLRHGRAVNRSWLAGTLWTESSGSQALQNLRHDLLGLRKALGPESDRLQAPARGSLAIDLSGAVVDVLQFDAAIQAGDEAALRNAVELYTGPLLESCVEEWAFSERQTRAEQCLTALERLADGAAARSEHREAIRYLRRAEALDPLRDSLPRRLMASLAAAGDPAAAIQTYRDFRLRLQEELAAAPDEATTRLFHEIRATARRHATVKSRQSRVESPTRPYSPASEAPPPQLSTLNAQLSTAVPPPRPLTSLIGREQKVGQVREALQQARLVTLVGGGGVGKTRLALEVALQASDESPGAVWVELAPLADGAVVLPSVAAALGLRDDGSARDEEALTQQLVARLAGEAPLLVLDNCEHLLEATARVVRLLLQRSPELRILATSRQRLRLPGEVAWRVPSLPVPVEVDSSGSGTREAGGVDRPTKTGSSFPSTINHQPSTHSPSTINHQLSTLLQCPSVRLFVERAAAVRPGFRLGSDAEAAAVGLICCRLDGIPLAIELAAARVRVLTVQQIGARLDDRFALLTGGERGALPRHQTLRALIDWSYDSLSAAEAALLRHLSVFAGGWTLEAAEAVCGGGAPGSRLPAPREVSLHAGSREPGAGSPDVLDLLDALVDRSLVLVDEVAEGLRYRILETVREYAREKLAASGELAAVRDRHRNWFLQLAEQYDDAHGSGQATWAARLEAERDNLRAALAWCQEAAHACPVQGSPSAHAEAGLRLATALAWFWLGRGYLAEGLQWLEGALARSGPLPERLRAPAFLAAAHLAGTLGRPDQSQALLGSAREEQEKALRQSRASGNRAGVAQALLLLADIQYQQNDMDAAERLAREAREHVSALGDRVGLERALRWMTGVALWRGDRQAARPLLEERLAICRELGDPELLVHALGGLGHCARDEGDFARARPLYRESLLLRREAGYWVALAQSLEDFAVLAGREQHAARAIRLLGAAETFCETLGARPPVADGAQYERTVAEGRAALGEAAFAAAWAEGRALSLEQAVQYALEEVCGG
jgi:predicted ATPase/DNA-binding SARP family transcriptional activator